MVISRPLVKLCPRGLGDSCTLPFAPYEKPHCLRLEELGTSLAEQSTAGVDCAHHGKGGESACREDSTTALGVAVNKPWYQRL